jgi:hypothetical protein
VCRACQPERRLTGAKLDHAAHRRRTRSREASLACSKACSNHSPPFRSPHGVS